MARILPRTPGPMPGPGGPGAPGRGEAMLTPALAVSAAADRDVVVREHRAERVGRDKKAKSAHGLSLLVVAK